METSLTILFFLLLFPQPVPRCDLDRVSHAVARYETGGCTTGVAKYNNCHGFRVKGEWLKFNSPEESHEYFKRLWVKRYSGGCPTIIDAERYDSKVNGANWLREVSKSL